MDSRNSAGSGPSADPSPSADHAPKRAEGAKTKRATVACTACRKRQVKCAKGSSGPDCQRCEKLGLVCEYKPLQSQKASHYDDTAISVSPDAATRSSPHLPLPVESERPHPSSSAPVSPTGYMVGSASSWDEHSYGPQYPVRVPWDPVAGGQSTPAFTPMPPDHRTAYDPWRASGSIPPPYNYPPQVAANIPRGYVNTVSTDINQAGWATRSPSSAQWSPSQMASGEVAGAYSPQSAGPGGAPYYTAQGVWYPYSHHPEDHSEHRAHEHAIYSDPRLHQSDVRYPSNMSIAAEERSSPVPALAQDAAKWSENMRPYENS